MSIENIIKEFKEVKQRESELSYQIGEHYYPIINKLLEDKDKIGLEKLLNEIPECIVKLGVYQALRELKNNS